MAIVLSVNGTDTEIPKMKSDKLNYSLLARYMTGECTDREREIIEQWMSEDPRNKKGMEEFQRIWEISGQKDSTSKDDFGIDGEWDKLKGRLMGEGELRKGIEKGAAKFQASTVHSTMWQITRVAAIILISGLFGVFSYQYWSQPEPDSQEQAFREISTEKAQRANSTLGDGTQVLLNADSRMKLPSEFASDVREVFLEGEAYFDVADNPDKPFVIHSGESMVRVLGTSFSVRSYPEDKELRVVVQEGRVSLEPENRKSSEKVTLRENELGRYSLKSDQIETQTIDDMQLYLSWREGYLKFRETPMHRVAIELERRYGVEVDFRYPEVEEKLLTAFLKSRSIRNVLDVIAMSLNIEYELEDNNVTFYHE